MFHKKIELRISFVMLAVVMIALGYSEQFFILFFFVSLHESAHIAAARWFRLPVEKWVVSPLGQMALIRGLETEPAAKRAAVYLAGPAASFVLFLICLGAGRLTGANFFRFGGTVNLTLCLLNLLPVYPLDGGQLFRLFLGNTAGVMRANRIVVGSGRIAASLMMLCGLAQVVLFPYNISLYCVGFYLWKAGAREYLSMIHHFYQNFIFHPAKLTAKNITAVQSLLVHEDDQVKHVVARLRWNCFMLFEVTDGEKIYRRVTETELAGHVSRHGLSGRMGDIGDGADSCQTDAHDLY